ncbi:hypothetical protein ACIPV2_00145 [Microbacterium sp. NPDC089987]|uniref:hypothetical protein n=1 Tax=Microbacterium sp. NPDC089987 TaxID=3364202 RepID=UPI0037FF9373
MNIPVGVWVHYGFSDSPYSTTALRIADADKSLLVGRENELRTVLRDLASGAQMVALEGDYGVGKSSLAAIATAKAARWRQARSIDPLFLPAGRPLELEESDTAAKLERRAYHQVAGAILSHAEGLLRDGFRLNQVREFHHWLSTPAGGGWSAGIGASFPGVLGLNFSGGRSSTPNTGSGFNDTGVITLLDSWLAELFPTPGDGGVILLLDNLEVLRRFPNAVHLFESLRDRVFKRQGLRWIISGAEGTVRAALSTPKMSGVFPEPIDVLPLRHDQVKEVVQRRELALRSRSDAKLPVSPEAFESAYTATGRNLRMALGLAERFSMRTDPATMTWKGAEERDLLFLEWRAAEGKKVVEQVSDRVTKTGWKVLTTLVQKLDGFTTPGDYSEFGYKTMSSLLHQVQPLASLGLLTYTVDDDDQRRRLITATESGRLAVATRIGTADTDDVNRPRSSGQTDSGGTA